MMLKVVDSKPAVVEPCVYCGEPLWDEIGWACHACQSAMGVAA